ncbi:MAG TPA: divalent metal cation transporter [Actinomycetes bacterium]
MRKIFEIALGILTAIGGFVDIGDIVANTETGARFDMSLAWVVVVGVVGICVFAEMAGRVATVSGRPVFDLVRERLGARVALVNLLASFFITFLTLAAEIGGVALAIELATSVNYLLWIPLVAFLVWFVVWRVKFQVMENVFGLLGLALIVVAVALWRLHPDWGGLLHGATHPAVPRGEGHPSWWYFAIALLGAAMTPYEVFFFSSGAVEEGWTRSDLIVNRANVYIGFPLGGLLSLTLMIAATLFFEPRGIEPGHLSQVALPTALALGKLGLAALLVGFFAATFGAALETSLSCGYTVAQYFGFQWGKLVRPTEAPRFHLVTLMSIVLGGGLVLSTLDPIKLTEYSIVLSAAALPLTYFPILLVANDPDYMGDKVNSRFGNVIGSLYLVLLLIVAIVTIPLMILTKAGS